MKQDVQLYFANMMAEFFDTTLDAAELTVVKGEKCYCISIRQNHQVANTRPHRTERKKED